MDFSEVDDWEALDGPLVLEAFSKNELLGFLSSMILIRSVEKLVADKKRGGFIKGPVHLAAGQEAVAVGISKHLRPTDKVFGNHRSHAHLLALETNIVEFFGELLCKSHGLSGGMGGSMHLIDTSVGFAGAVPIVGGTIPLAVGAAMASKMLGEENISVTYFGDGACEEGVFHESLNLAKVKNVPVLFVAENNLFSSHLHISKRQTSPSLARFADSHHVPSVTLDGNDVLGISNAAEFAIKKMRSGGGPHFIEAITYRHYGHVDWREDIDVGVKRSKKDLEKWLQRDPINRLRRALEGKQIYTVHELNELVRSIEEQVYEAWKIASSLEAKQEQPLTKYVFARRR